MKLKLVASFLLLLFIFSLSACGFFAEELELDEPLLHKNIDGLEDEKQRLLNDVSQPDFSNYDIVTTRMQQGIVVLRNTVAEIGVFSLGENRMIVAFDNHSIYHIQTSNTMGLYLYLLHDDDTTSVVDIGGHEVLPADHYHEIYVNAVRSAEEIRETVEYLTLEDYHEYGWGGLTAVTHRVDTTTGERHTLDQTTQDTYERGARYGEESILKEPLDEIGLKDHTYTLTNNIYRIFNAEGSLIASFRSPSSRNTVSLMFNGHLFYQAIDQVPDTYENYHFVTEGRKYLAHTVSIDLTTGDRTYLDVDYAIAELQPFLDADGVIRYAAAVVHQAVDKLILPDEASRRILNADGDFVARVDGIQFNRLVRLDETHIYDRDSRVVMTAAFEPIYQLQADPHFIQGENWLRIRHQGRYGLIDTAGTVLIPFEYTSLDPHFLDGSTLAFNSEGTGCIVSVVAEPYCPEGLVNNVTLTRLYLTRSDRDATANTTYRFTLYDYTNTEIMTFDSDVANPNTYMVNNPYVDATVLTFDGTEETVVIHYTLSDD